MKFPEGIIKLIYKDTEYTAQYIGRQKGFECMVCGKGGNCYTFNVFTDIENYGAGSYETWGFGAEHIKQVSFYQWLWLENTVVLHASSDETARTAYNRICEEYPNNTLYESRAEYNSGGTYTTIFWKRGKYDELKF
jgi:hypothetical protein